MKRFINPNIGITGRWLRGLGAVGLLAGAWFTLTFSPWLALLLGISGIFVLYEALRGWCVLRACGVKTRF